MIENDELWWIFCRGRRRATSFDSRFNAFSVSLRFGGSALVEGQTHGSGVNSETQLLYLRALSPTTLGPGHPKIAARP